MDFGNTETTWPDHLVNALFLFTSPLTNGRVITHPGQLTEISGRPPYSILNFLNTIPLRIFQLDFSKTLFLKQSNVSKWSHTFDLGPDSDFESENRERLDLQIFETYPYVFMKHNLNTRGAFHIGQV